MVESPLLTYSAMEDSGMHLLTKRSPAPPPPRAYEPVEILTLDAPSIKQSEATDTAANVALFMASGCGSVSALAQPAVPAAEALAFLGAAMPAQAAPASAPEVVSTPAPAAARIDDAEEAAPEPGSEPMTSPASPFNPAHASGSDAPSERDTSEESSNAGEVGDDECTGGEEGASLLLALGLAASHAPALAQAAAASSAQADAASPMLRRETPRARPASPREPASAASQLKRRGVADRASLFFCKFQGCNKSYGCPDAVRKHCRKQHSEWLRSLGNAGPSSYSYWDS